MRNFSKEELYKLYITQNKSKREVAEILHTNERTLGDYFKKYGIKKSKEDVVRARESTCLKNFGSTNPMKNIEIAQELRSKQIDSGKIKDIPYEELYDALVNKKMLVTNAAKFFNTSISTIKRLAKENGIEICKEELKTVDRDELENYYITEKHTREECAEHFGVSYSHIKTFLKKYKIEKSKDEIFENIKRGHKRKTGYEYALQNPESIEKQKATYKNRTEEEKSETIEKRKNTCMDRFGANNPLCSEDIKEKAFATNIERYGYKTSIQNPEIRKKAEDTLFDRFGVRNPSLVPEFKQKRENTMRERFGVCNYGEVVLSEDIRNLLNDKDKFKKYVLDNKLSTTYDIAESIGCSITTITNRIHEYNLEDLVNRSQSHFETEVNRILTDWNIRHYKTRQILSSKQEIDFYCPNEAVGFEFNGNWPHCSINKDKKYHMDKSLEAQEKNVRFVHIYEYEWCNPQKQPIILSLMRGALGLFDKKIYARNCKIKEVGTKEYFDFCNQNHTQGYRQARVIYGLYFNDELVQIMSFSHNDKYEWEIIRECSKINTQVIGGNSKLFKYFIKTQNPNSIFSYCDFNKFNGKGYELLGMKFIGYTGPDMKWYLKGNIVVNRSPSKNKEFKEKAIAQIWGAGSKKYLWTKPQEIS